MANPLVLIVGAGPTGMTAAIELKRAGMDVRIVDKSDHMAQFSQALVIQARTLEQLQRYGIADEAVARGRKLNGGKFFSEGKQIASFNINHIQSRYAFALFIPQSETEALLNEHMESLGVRTERKVELSELRQHGGLIRATLVHPDGNSEEVSPRWLIGCDGAHSAVREMTGIPFQGGNVELSFFLGDMELEGPDVPDDDLTLHLHRGDVVFMARLTDKLVRLIVAIHGQQDELKDRELSVADFQKAVDLVGVHVKVLSGEWMTPFRVNDRQAQHYRIGNVFLAGDASHIHSPVGGQGMNTGMQDVANLAWKLSAVARGANEKLPDSYDEERGEVGRALLKFTERGLKLATLTNPLLEELRDTFAPLVLSLESVQRAAGGFISETAIEYRSSSIVADRGGDGELRAGDRLPDLALRNGAGAGSLLADWKAPKHLAIALGASAEQLEMMKEDLPFADLRPLDGLDLDENGRKLLGVEAKLLIVRPDGYVGFRGAVDKREQWRIYGLQDGLVQLLKNDREAVALLTR